MKSYNLLTKKNPITYWLAICCFMIVFMIVLGGFVRLTDSGLSIVEWKPITGAIPPLSESDWHEEFSKYQNSPEFKHYNYDMSVSEFKFIFWSEFIHRLAGRLLGLLYLLPLIYFYLKGHLTQSKSWYLVISLLLLLQGVMGWYMVKSGLINNPHVSHFRLALHLILAVIIYSMLFWLFLKSSLEMLLIQGGGKLLWYKNIVVVSIALLFVQIFAGGLVAGLDAGLVYNSFPLMGSGFIPSEIMPYSLSAHNFSDPVFVQFHHRVIAYLLSGVISYLVVILYRSKSRKLQKISIYLALALFLQMFAGILTVLYSVPIVIALLHQLGAMILLSILIWALYLLCS
jgi:cytochrome c oxidase assembly protein subunit 15